MTIRSSSIVASFLVLLLLPGVAFALPASPTNVQVFHRSGQSFVTWDQVPGPGISYRLYRSNQPIQSLSLMTPIGEVRDSTTVNTRAAVEGAGALPYRIIEGQDLLPSQGLFVHTAAETGSFYYTVSSVDSSGENTTVDFENSTMVAVPETLALPQPVLQRTLNPGNGRLYDIYVHWTSNVGTALYPKMCVVPSKPFTFMVMRLGTGTQHPLIVRLHAYGGSYYGGSGPYTGIGYPQEWALSPDDHLDNDILSTHWYGYNENFDWKTGQPIPTSGVNIDYTLRRVVYAFNWALATLDVDSNRVYLYGNSMGGIGATFVGYALRDRIAARYSVVPKFDFVFLTEYYPGCQFNPNGYYRGLANRIWGTVATNLLCSDGIPTYSRLNYPYLINSVAGEDLPPHIALFGRNDQTVGWSEKIETLQTMEAARQSAIFFWDSRMHNSTDSLVEWQPEDIPGTWLQDYKLHESFPAFANCSANGNPGTGDPTHADQFGTINGHLRWDKPPTDQAESWTVVIRNRDLTYTLGSGNLTKFAPESITVDVTPRRLQSFHAAPGISYPYAVRDNTTGVLMDSSFVVADASGLATIPSVLVTDEATKLTIYAAGPTGVASVTPVFGEIQLFPNPTTGISTLRFRLETPGLVTSSVYDVTGRQVVTTGPVQYSAGEHSFVWDGKNANGMDIPSGIYFYQLRVGTSVETRKLTLIR